MRGESDGASSKKNEIDCSPANGSDEKEFSVLKNDIGALPLNGRKDAPVAGALFVCFLALILRMRRSGW
jgi:hypothetical protein